MFSGVQSLSDENKCAIHTSWSSNENWPYDWTEICNSLLELCPPTNLNVSKGQSENTLTWNAPGNCEDFVVSSLPYYSIGNNATSGDDWNVAAGEYQGNDVAYKLMLEETTSLNISTCNPQTDFDTQLSIFNGCDGDELFFNDDPGSGDSGETDTLLCNNDELFAMLNGVTLEPGTYYVVVDGFDGETGNYGLFVEESESMNMDPERYTVVGQIPSRMEKLDRLGYFKAEIQLYEERTELYLTNSNRTRFKR